MNIKSILIGAAALTALVACAPESNTTATSDSANDQESAAPALDVNVDIAFEKFTMPNGLRVIVHEDRKAPIVSVGVWYHVGSKDEPENRSGFAHLFEHLMFNGSENFDDEFFGPFEAVGATGQNGTTNQDRTNYFETVPTPALEMALWLESDRMGHLLGAVTQEKLDEQRGVVQNEKRRGDNQPYGTIRYNLFEGTFPKGHPYNHSVIGSLENLDAASLDDVKGWFNKYYGAANTVLVLAGDIDVAKAKELAAKYFGDIQAGPPLQHHEAWIPTKDTNVKEVKVDRVPQALILRSWAVASRTDEDIEALELAASVLGAGKNSRLFKSLVYDKQLATQASASVLNYELSSVFLVQAVLRPGADAQEAERLIDAEIENLLANGPTAEELARSKTRITAGRVRGLERIGGFSGKGVALAQGELYAGDAGFVNKSLARLNAATPASVTSTANAWLKKGYYQLTMVPYGRPSVSESTVDRTKGLPKVGDLPTLEFPAVEQATLSNGMKILVATRSAVPVVNMGIQFDAGFAADQGRPLGTASFTLNMMDEGTTSRSALELAAEMEALGANASAGSNLDTSFFFGSALKVNLDKSLGLFADIVQNPSFSQAEIDRIRPSILAGIKQEKAQPRGLANRLLPPLLYTEGHAYAAPLSGSGTAESVAQITRADMVKFHEDLIRPDNATMVVVGDITMAEALPALEKAFGGWKASDTPIPTKNITSVPAPTKARVIIVDKPDSPQAVIYASQLVPGTGDPNDLALNTATTVFGGQFTARINMNLREDKGWSYGAFSFAGSSVGQRIWRVQAEVQIDKTKESMQEIIREITEFVSTNPTTDAELLKVVRNNTNSLPGRFETSGAVMQSMLTNLSFGRPYDYATTLKDRYDALDIKGITEVAKATIKPDLFTWVIVGDRSKIEDGIKSLGIAEIEYYDEEGNKAD